jgi:hypothetical protein
VAMRYEPHGPVRGSDDHEEGVTTARESGRRHSLEAAAMDQTLDGIQAFRVR